MGLCEEDFVGEIHIFMSNNSPNGKVKLNLSFSGPSVF